jgi:uridine phosphorylase
LVKRLSSEEPQDATGRPYHIKLSKKDIGRVALLPGDPDRVPVIASRLKAPVALSSNREYTAWAGGVAGERVVVMSTGIGGPATAIAVEELARLGTQVMIRVGTCGSLQPELKVGSLVIADAAVRLDGTSAEYVHLGYPAAATPGVVLALRDSARDLKKDAAVGVAASTDSFYVGQGRKAFGGYSPSDKAHLVNDLRAAKVLCFEMEAATLFTLGRIFGLRTGAVFAVVGNRSTGEFKPGAGVQAAIDVAVGAVKNLRVYGV